jgi:hypothetical protein
MEEKEHREKKREEESEADDVGHRWTQVVKDGQMSDKMTRECQLWT